MSRSGRWLRGSDGDVHLVGGPRTIRAFYELGALDRLEIVILPILLGSGSRFHLARPSPHRCGCDRTGPFPTDRPSSSTRWKSTPRTVEDPAVLRRP